MSVSDHLLFRELSTMLISLTDSRPVFNIVTSHKTGKKAVIVFFLFVSTAIYLSHLFNYFQSSISSQGCLSTPFLEKLGVASTVPSSSGDCVSMRTLNNFEWSDQLLPLQKTLKRFSKEVISQDSIVWVHPILEGCDSPLVVYSWAFSSSFCPPRPPLLQTQLHLP